VHSAVRRQLYPAEGPPVYTGINMWRGVTRWPPYLSGESFVQCGWLDVGKIVVYPIRKELDAQGRQLVTWTAEFRSPRNVQADWNLNGRLEDFLPTFENFRFNWLDIAEMLRNAEVVLEYPMVDREPLSRWTFGRVTLVGDAAHPMHPRGANGAAQGILDARTLAGCLARERDPVAALAAYENARLKAANEVVLASRSISPDTILRVVHERTGDKPFERVEDVVSEEELAALMEKYKRVAGFEREALKNRPSLVS
jgi:2-polyprenyl-6-methoxyphenol hydroxylase-like FAD-dependent oxidoreductase